MSDLEGCQELTVGYLDLKLQRNFKLNRYWVVLFLKEIILIHAAVTRWRS